MREIVSPLSGIRSPFGQRRVSGGGIVSGLSLTATKVGVDEAPQGVFFEATALGVSDQADVVMWWDFGDDYQFRYLPTDTKANDRQSGTAIGHRAAHVYRSAGTYTVTCTAYQFVGGEIVSVSDTVEVVVAASDPAITERIAISKTGSFAGAPAGATQIDWSGGVPSTFSFLPNKAYYFQAGQTFTLDGVAADFDTGGVGKVAKYGAGNNPVLAQSATATGNFFWLRGDDHDNFSVCEVDLLGTFDVNNNPNWNDAGVYPTPPTAPGNTGIFTLNGDNGGQSMLFYGMKIEGFRINVHFANPAAAAITHFVDCETTNWFDYGLYSAAAGVVAFIGVRSHQKIGTQPLPAAVPQSNRGWNSTDGPNTARHGALRVPGASLTIANKCSLLSYRCGWSAGSTPGVAAPQSAMRLGTSEVAGENYHVTQCDLEGGETVLTANVANTDTIQGVVENYIVESNFLTQDRDGYTTAFISTSKPGAHFRNNIAHYRSGIAPNGTVSTIRLVRDYNTVSFGLDRPSCVYGNTLIVDGDTPGIDWQTATQISAASRPITYANNLIQMNGAFNSAGSAALFQTNYSPVEAAFPFLPKFGSPAYGGYTTGKLAPLAQDGTERTAPFSLGAGEESGEPVVTVAINQAEIASGDVLGTDVTETGTIVFAGSAPPLTTGDIGYNWLVNGIERADGFTVAATDVVRARASFTHSTGPQVVLSAPLVAQASGVAAPTLTGTPTLLASWDFANLATVTEVGGAVSQITGSDGTSVTLAQATAAQRPLLATVGAYKVAQMIRANSTFLQVANGLGGQTAMTQVVIASLIDLTADSTTHYLLDVGRRGALTNRERTSINIFRTTAGTRGWRALNAGTTQTTEARDSTILSENIRLAINVARGVGSAPELYMDGGATAFTGAAPSGTPGAATHTTLGAEARGNAEGNFANAYVYRVLIYSGALNATQLEEVAVWAAANYGTPNNA